MAKIVFPKWSETLFPKWSEMLFPKWSETLFPNRVILRTSTEKNAVPKMARNPVPKMVRKAVPTMVQNAVPTMVQNAVPTVVQNAVPTVVQNAVPTVPRNLVIKMSQAMVPISKLAVSQQGPAGVRCIPHAFIFQVATFCIPKLPAQVCLACRAADIGLRAGVRVFGFQIWL